MSCIISFRFIKMLEPSEQIQYLDYKRPPKSKWPLVSQLHEIPLLPILKEWKGIKQTQQPQPIVEKQEQLPNPIKIVKPKFNLVLEYKKYRLKAKIADFKTEKADVLMLPLRRDECKQYPEIEEQQLIEDIEKMKEKGVKKGSLYVRNKKLFNYKVRAFIRIEQEFQVKDMIQGLKELINLTLQKKISAKSIGFILQNQQKLKEFVQQISSIEIQNDEARFQFLLFLKNHESFVELARIVSSL